MISFRYDEILFRLLDFESHWNFLGFDKFSRQIAWRCNLTDFLQLYFEFEPNWIFFGNWQIFCQMTSCEFTDFSATQVPVDLQANQLWHIYNIHVDANTILYASKKDNIGTIRHLDTFLSFVKDKDFIRFLIHFTSWH